MSEVLENVILWHVAGQMEQTKLEKKHLWQFRTDLETHVGKINSLCYQFDRAATPESVQSYLEVKYPAHAMKLFNQPVVDDDGWQEVS